MLKIKKTQHPILKKLKQRREESSSNHPYHYTDEHGRYYDEEYEDKSTRKDR